MYTYFYFYKSKNMVLSIDIILALYPLYLSIEAIKLPNQHQNVEHLRHCLIFWVLWFNVSFSSIIIYTFFWWVPFTSILDILKIIILILAYKSIFANTIQKIILQPLWNNFRDYFPTIFKNSLIVISTKFPIINKFRIYINDFVRNFIGVVETTYIAQSHYNDISQIPITDKKSL